MLYLVIISFLVVLYLFSTVEQYIDYDSINDEIKEVYNKVLEEKTKLFLAKKEKIVNDIRNDGIKIEDIRAKGDYLPTENYPFYDGSAFYNSTPVHKVMTGIPSLYSGGDLKSKPNKYQPFEIANYNPGIARSSSDIQAPANF